MKHLHKWEPAILVKTSWGKRVLVRRRFTTWARRDDIDGWLCGCGQQGYVVPA